MSNQPSQQTLNLAALVRLLSYALHRANPTSDLPQRAAAYLAQEDLSGSILRDEVGVKSKPEPAPTQFMHHSAHLDVVHDLNVTIDRQRTLLTNALAAMQANIAYVTREPALAAAIEPIIKHLRKTP